MKFELASEQRVDAAWGNAEAWEPEYSDIRAIPSSFRSRPSRVLSRLLADHRYGSSSMVLDAGCGTGRHALHFASAGATVHAVDISTAACSVLRANLQSDVDNRRRISVFNDEIRCDDVPDSSYDLILDSYASCHILDVEMRTAYLRALLARLRPGGMLFTSTIGIEDRYYSPTDSTPRDTYVCVDPVNGIAKMAESRSSFLNVCRSAGNVTAVAEQRFVERVHAEPDLRHVLAATLTKSVG